MRGRSNTVFAPLPSQDSAPPPFDLDPSTTAHIPPTPESPPPHSRMTSPRRMSQLQTPSKSSRRRSGTVSQGNRGGNLPTPAHSSDSEDGEAEGMAVSERVGNSSRMAKTSQDEVDESRRGKLRSRSAERDELVGVEGRLETMGDLDEEQDPMLQQIARERRLVWEQSRSKSFGRKKWLILAPSESSTQDTNSSRYSTVSSSGQNEGVLLPLQSTLPAQAQLIAREFSLSSIAGIQLYLCLPDTPSSRARLTESSWRVLWTNHLEGRSYAETLRGANGLPIAGRIEFDVDHNTSKRLPRRIDRPRPAFSSSTPSRAPSPSLRFGTSLPYSRSSTPSWRENHRSGPRHSTYLEQNESGSDYERADLVTTSSSSRPNTFRPRPLSSLSQIADKPHDPSSPTSSRISSRAATPTSRPVSRVHVRHLFDKDVDEIYRPVVRPLDGKARMESTTDTRPRTSSRIFAFPRPDPRDNAGDESSEDRSREESTLNWTIELDRLREVSETSLFAGGTEPDTSISTEEDVSDGEAHESPHNERHPIQATPLSHPVPIEPLSLATLPSRRPIVELPSTSASSYPYFSTYPAVYPHFDIYTRRFASELSPFQSLESLSSSNLGSIVISDVPSLPVISIDQDLDDEQWRLEQEGENGRHREASTSEGEFIDNSVEWYQTSTPSERSPGSSSFEDDEDDGEGTSDSDGEGLFAVYDGTMLSIIEEESDTRSFTAQIDANDSREGRAMENIMEEASEEMASAESESREEVSASDLDESPEVPVITYSKPNISCPSQSDHSQPSRPPSLELDRITSSRSPLPSPTITPSTFPSDTPEAPEDVDNQEFDYSFEYEAEVGTDELPYITSPGLQQALGLDDSPEIQPLSFPSDESESDSDESFYKTRDFALDRQGLDHFASGGEADDSCQTFDHLSPLPNNSIAEEDSSPILFTFPSSDSRDMLDAIAQFVCEAQTQSINRRGKFRVAFGGGELPRLLRLALENDERVEWEKWEIFFVDSDVNGSTKTKWEEEFLTYFPISPSQIHLPTPNDDDIKPLSENYERQLLSAFPGVGLFAGDSIPRFDLVLLDVEEQARILQLSTSSQDANRWITTCSSRISFTPSLLSASRRIAVLALSSNQQIILAEMLSTSGGGEGKNVVIFADELAVEGLSYPRTPFWED